MKTPDRTEQVREAFAIGGDVTAYEADAWLHKKNGTFRKAILANTMNARRLKAKRERFGKKWRYWVDAKEAAQFFKIAM